MDLDTLAKEMREGFAQVNSRIDGTNSRLDETNSRLDETNSRLDETNNKLEATNQKLDRFQFEVNGKLDGIQSFLLASERNVGRLEHRLEIVEKRLDKLEDQDKSA